jgi:hypothetical protein
MNGTLEEALKLQKPQPDDALVMTRREEGGLASPSMPDPVELAAHFIVAQTLPRAAARVASGASTIAQAGHHEGG